MKRFSRRTCDDNFKFCTNLLVYIVVIIVIDILVLFFLAVWFMNPIRGKLASPAHAESKPESIRVVEVSVQLTAYSPCTLITDSTPFMPASGRRITIEELHQLQIVAVSRELMKEYDIEYGDKIWIPFRVEDTTHKDTKNTVDVMFRNILLARLYGRRPEKVLILVKNDNN